MSAAERADEASSAEQANEWTVRANEWTDERVAQYCSLPFWLLSTIVHYALGSPLYYVIYFCRIHLQADKPLGNFPKIVILLKFWFYFDQQ